MTVEETTNALRQHGIEFEVANYQAGHINVLGHKKGVIDYYVNNQRWQIRGGKSGHDFGKLLGVMGVKHAR